MRGMVADRLGELDRAELEREVQAIVGADGVLRTEAERRVYDGDAYTLHRAQPDAVALPRTTEEVSAVVVLCARRGIPVVARGAGTGLSGGATPVRGGVVLSTMRMNRILRVDPASRLITAQAGATNASLTRAAAPHGLHFAPDPSSQVVSTIGGNVAENAGGPHTLKYGVTANHVVAMTVVLADGRVTRLGSDADDAPGPDLARLFVGSEGTLGIVTEVTARLTPLPEAWRTLLAVFDDVEDCTATVTAIIAEGIVPAALEMIDEIILRAIERALSAGLPEDAAAVLVIEVDGPDAGLDRDADRVEAICRAHRARDVRRAADEEERARLWMARKKGVGAVGRLAPNMVTQDGVIPRTRLPEALRRIAEIGRRRRVRVCNVFHAGDGNLHPCIVYDQRDADEVLRVEQANREIVELCLAMGGSITGEHGVGIEKLSFMRAMFAESDLDAMRSVRRALDPAGLLNPGKLLPESPSA